MRLVLALTTAALLVAPGAGHAPEGAEPDPARPQPETAQQLGTGQQHHVAVDEGLMPGWGREGQLATAGNAPGDDGLAASAVGDRALEVRPALGGFKLNLGRDNAPLGKLPSDPRPTYGEVGLAIDVGTSFSLVPSYRLNWTDKDDAGRDGVADHALKLGANLKF